MSNEIVKPKNNAIQQVNNFAVPTGYICTINIEEIDGKIALATAVNNADSMKDLVNVPIMVRDILTMPGVRSRTGEACTNTYLICDDGKALMTQSQGIADSVPYIVGICTNPITGEFTAPVDMGLALQVVAKDLPNGNTLKTVIPVRVPNNA